MALELFHPIIQDWFRSRFAGETEPQQLGWPVIARGDDTLISAPTGSGKTLTAFLAVIDRLLKEAIAGTLAAELRVVYVSPLRALSNDMHRNLEVPLGEILAEAERQGVSIPPLSVGIRTGDTPSHRRTALIKRPPHILVTTPESLFLMLTAEKARSVLTSVDTLIVDEIHALVRDKRGSHLAVTMERLAAVSERRLQRIGISATQKPIERVGAFLVGIPEHRGESLDVDESIESRSPNSTPLVTPTPLFCGDADAIRKPVSGEGSLGLLATADSQSTPVPSLAVLPTIVNVGHQRDLDLGIEVPPSLLGAVCTHDQWAEVNGRIVELIESHRSTLIFVNTRRLAERLTFQLTELLGEAAVGAHHGSLAKELRFDTEQRLKEGTLKAVVATASLELGIDVGYIDLVIQIGSPRAIGTFLQRIGRSGHALGLTPKGRLFALTRDELVECMGLVRAVRDGRLDVTPIPESPLDILAQQIVAEVAAQEWEVESLYRLIRRAYPFRNLSRSDFDAVIHFLSEGITGGSGRHRALIHHDHVYGKLRGRKGARLTAINNAGAIGEVDNVRVVAEPEMTVVGSVDEEFAVESSAGDIFLLGNTSWRIQGLRGNDLIVSDAHGAPPTIPFWRGEAQGRTVELSEEVSRLRSEIAEHVRGTYREANRKTGESLAGKTKSLAAPSTSTGSPSLPDPIPRVDLREVEGSSRANGESYHDVAEPFSVSENSLKWLMAEACCGEFAARQAIEYVAAEQAAVRVVPTQTEVVFERFFDESGGMQLVVHAPFGGRINRAWGLAMRKRFCRSFDFELQATADDEGFILSLGPQHSFPIESLFPMLRTDNVRNLLEQAILYVPIFPMRWRWNVTRSLQVDRMRNGKKTPPALQRFRSEDLLTAVFPKLTGCQEEHTGDHILPDHPLVRQTVDDCFSESLDLDGLIEVLGRIERGEIRLIARDTREPSPFAYELLNANPYAFLDGGEAQERRARMATTRRTLTVDSVRDLGHLDPAAIELVVMEASPPIRDADELHDLLLSRIILPIPFGDSATARASTSQNSETSFQRQAVALIAQGSPMLQQLAGTGRATVVTLSGGRQGWVAAERLPAARAIFPDLLCESSLTVPPSVRQEWESAEARTELIRGLLETSGPITSREVAELTGLEESNISASLEALEGEGVVLRGQFRPEGNPFLSNANTYSGQPSPAKSQESTEDASSMVKDVHSPGDGESDDGAEKGVEWCHRRLLSRIHRLTVAGLRREIQPVGREVFARHLLRLHGVCGDERPSGSNGLFEIIGQLQGLDVQAASWERDILPVRMETYERKWLDELCLTGEVGWGRLFPPARDPDKSPPMASITRVVPVSLFLREDRHWLIDHVEPISTMGLSSPAEQVLELLLDRGAMFASDLLDSTDMLATQLDGILGELTARGLTTADGFAGLRSLVREGESESKNRHSRNSARLVRRRRNVEGAGRWSVWRDVEDREVEDTHDRKSSTKSSAAKPDTATSDDRERTEQWGWQLLRRWGVVCKDLVRREPGAPAWWKLVQVYRRLEAQGQIRGGRFVSGLAGEQFAVGDTVHQLRQLRNQQHAARELVLLSAADPLNLVGVINDAPRVPGTAANRIVLWNGNHVASWQGGEFSFCKDVNRQDFPVTLKDLIAATIAPPTPCGLIPIPQSILDELPTPASDDRGELQTHEDPEVSSLGRPTKPKFPRPSFA
ncbi:MAG: DEAD/DEAH box helicase [Planctomycetaceae bacterium]